LGMMARARDLNEAVDAFKDALDYTKKQVAEAEPKTQPDDGEEIPRQMVSLAVGEDAQVNLDVPAGVDGISVGFDCQENGHSIVVLGHTKDGSMYVLGDLILQNSNPGFVMKGTRMVKDAILRKPPSWTSR